VHDLARRPDGNRIGAFVGRLSHPKNVDWMLASGGLYASLWNRQRQAEKAREQLAEVLAQEGERIKGGRLDGGDASFPAEPGSEAAKSPDGLPSVS